MELLKLEVDKYYETLGGWKAKVIWKCSDISDYKFFVVHKPGEENESVPISHTKTGRVLENVFGVYNAPNYSFSHPANIVKLWRD